MNQSFDAAVPDEDPFAGLEDDATPTGAEVAARLLADTRRGWVPLRKVLVQRPNTELTRSSTLAKFVTGRRETALDALLLLHALGPILDGSPLPMAVWANALQLTGPNAASKAFATLEDMRLVDRVRGEGTATNVVPLLEDGSGLAWSRPGSTAGNAGPGYFALPDDYWTAGWNRRLSLPGKAMLLIMLAETQDPNKTPSTFAMPVEKAKDWYGISERTAERGYRELGVNKIMRVKEQAVKDHRSPTGVRKVMHRALTGPFSTAARASAQAQSRAAAQGQPRAEAVRPNAPGLSDEGRNT
ncbi:MAG TPA: hypothetical protein VIM10_15100 [Actinopolymorphaceae bacterium]